MSSRCAASPACSAPGGVDSGVTNTGSSIVQNTFAGTAIAIATVVMDWKLALVCLVVVPLFLIASLRLGRQRRALARGRQRRMAGLAGLIEESLSVAGVLLTKTLGGQQAQARRFEAESRRLSENELKAAMSGRCRRRPVADRGARRDRLRPGQFPLRPGWPAVSLRDLDFTVPAGTTTAIVGETGAGKTTVA